MFVVAFVIGVPLLGGLFVAVRRFRAKDGAEPRRLIAGRGVIARVGAGLGVVALAIFVFGIVMTEEARDASAEESGEPLEITSSASSGSGGSSIRAARRPPPARASPTSSPITSSSSPWTRR